jgi:hypothetical protein
VDKKISPQRRDNTVNTQISLGGDSQISKKNCNPPFKINPRFTKTSILPKPYRVSLKNSLNQKQGSFSKFEINIVENSLPLAKTYNNFHDSDINNIYAPSTPSFNPVPHKRENEIQIFFIVLKDDWKKKSKILKFYSQIFRKN